MKVITSPTRTSYSAADLVIFAEGSIEMDTADDWQAHLIKLLRNAEQPSVRPFVVLNPRRADWDSSWTQTADDPNFLIQVSWKLEGIEDCNVLVIYFDPKTKSPDSLIELGLAAGLFPEKVLVICPEGYWRKGNVDILCARYDIPQFHTLADAVDRIVEHIDLW